MVDRKEGGQLLDILWRSLGLAIEDCRRCYFIATNLLGDLLESQLPFRLGTEQSRCRSRKVRMLRNLLLLAVLLKMAKVWRAHVKRSQRHLLEGGGGQ